MRVGPISVVGAAPGRGPGALAARKRLGDGRCRWASRRSRGTRPIDLSVPDPWRVSKANFHVRCEALTLRRPAPDAFSSSSGSYSAAAQGDATEVVVLGGILYGVAASDGSTALAARDVHCMGGVLEAGHGPCDAAACVLAWLQSFAGGPPVWRVIGSTATSEQSAAAARGRGADAADFDVLAKTRFFLRSAAGHVAEGDACAAVALGCVRGGRLRAFAIGEVDDGPMVAMEPVELDIGLAGSDERRCS